MSLTYEWKIKSLRKQDNPSIEVNDIIFAGLQELPHRVVDGLIKNLMSQAQAQLGGPSQ